MSNRKYAEHISVIKKVTKLLIAALFFGFEKMLPKKPEPRIFKHNHVNFPCKTKNLQTKLFCKVTINSRNLKITFSTTQERRPKSKVLC